MLALVDRIGRLQVHGLDRSAASAVGVELAADLELQPGNLPPDAILLIRRVQAQWPRDGQRSQRARAIEQAVEDCARRAARPWLSPFDLAADAIWFSSRAELLACLARDARTGHRPWWWSWLGLDPDAFVRAWGQAPELVPAVLSQLATADALVPVLARVAVSEARELAAAVATKWSVPAVLGVVQQEPMSATAVAEPDGPFHSWYQSGPGTPLAVAAMAGIALGLVRASGTVRGAVFARELQAWVRRSARTLPLPAEVTRLPDATAIRSSQHLAGQPQVRQVPLPEMRDTLRNVAEPHSATRLPIAATTPTEPLAVPILASPLGRRQSDASTPPTVTEPGPGHAETAAIASASSAATAVDPASAAPRPPLVLGSSSRVPGPVAAPIVIATRLGGVFYLVNVLLALEVWGDFTRPLHRDPGFSLWDAVAELARCLLRQSGARSSPLFRRRRVLARPKAIWAEDPIWGLLATLAGHRRISPRPVADPSWPWPPRVAAQLRGRDARADRSWLDRLAIAVGRRLAPMLPRPPRRWLAQRAQIRRGTERLEITFRLASHPLAVRVAGLDRDPGWVGNAGVDIRFRYV